MKISFSIKSTCKFLISAFVLASFYPIRVYPRNYEKVFKNFNNAKFIDEKEYSNIDKFKIKNGRNNYAIRYKKTRGKNFAKINQLFLFIIFVIICISIF